MKFILAFLAVVTVAYAYVPRLDGRIVGGKQVDISEFPYQVSVRVYDSHICGGTILSKFTVLTAAHCVDSSHIPTADYSVRVGNSEHENGISHRVSKIIINSNYDPITMNNDMAILKMSRSISLDDNAKPVDLQAVEVPAGTTAWVSGWGAEKEGASETPAALRAVDVAVISNADCNTIFDGGISSNMLCAQTPGHDSCQGDSGGPLVANGKLIGVVSWGYGCARPDFPGVYAKVSDMYSWIVSNM